MKQDELYLSKCYEVIDFMEKNHRNSSKYDSLERGMYFNWIKYNRKLMKVGKMKEVRLTLFVKLLEMGEKYKRVNQYV